jgi:hypothetical protein
LLSRAGAPRVARLLTPEAGRMHATQCVRHSRSVRQTP